MTKKIPISFNNQELEEIHRLANLLGYGGVYGEIPKTIKLSITLALYHIKTVEKVIPPLNTAELDVLLTSIKRLRKQRNALKELKNAREAAGQYNPIPNQSML